MRARKILGIGILILIVGLLGLILVTQSIIPILQNTGEKSITGKIIINEKEIPVLVRDYNGATDAQISYENDTLTITKEGKKLEFTGIKEDAINVGFDDKVNDKRFVDSFAVDPTELNFTAATFTTIAKGKYLFKCKEWDFENQECKGRWKKVQNLQPGEEYSIQITADDPGFGENNDTVLILDENDYLYNYTEAATNITDVSADIIANISDDISVMQVEIKEKNLTENNSEIYLIKNGNASDSRLQESITIDTSNITSSSTKFMKTGKGRDLIECNNWNSESKKCIENNWTKVKEIAVNQAYDNILSRKKTTYAETKDTVAVFDKKGNLLQYNQNIVNDTALSSDVEYDFIGLSVKKIKFYSYNKSSSSNDLVIEYSVNVSSPSKKLAKVFSIDPSNITFSHAEISATAYGKYLFKCIDWNASDQTCFGEWKKLRALTPGEEYIINITAQDPGFLETNNSIVLVDNNDTLLEYNETVISDVNNISDVQLDVYNGTINQIIIYNHNDSSESNILKLKHSTEESSYIQSYSIDPTNLSFSNATVTVTATGNELYKCKNWNFTSQTCIDNNWTLFKSDLTPGQQYTFTLTAEDPGFGENATGSPSDGISFFIGSDTLRASNGGGSETNDFSEVPIQLNDYGNTTQKATGWKCTGWSNTASNDVPEVCNGGWSCARWNGVTCAEYKCGGWTTGTSQTTQYCKGGWNCSNWNGNYCSNWTCLGLTATATQKDAYCTGVFNCTALYGNSCRTWNCSSWNVAGTSDMDYYCSGIWNCTTWSGNLCKTWNCTAFSSGGTADSDLYCSEGYNCTSWNGNICSGWQCENPLVGTVKYDYRCNEWNCSSWNASKDVCEQWGCVYWNSTGTSRYDYYCSGTWNATGWIDSMPPSSIANLNNQSADTTWIYWNWTNPADSDFSSAILYLNNVNVANTSNNYYNATGLTPYTNHTIRINTQDTNGNVNYTNVSNNASTLEDTPLVKLVAPANNYTEINTLNVDFTYNVSNSLNITYCNLYLTDPLGYITVYENSTVTKDTNQTFRINFGYNGNYQWSVRCTNTADITGLSEERNITLAIPGVQQLSNVTYTDYILHNESDSQYTSYNQMKNVSNDTGLNFRIIELASKNLAYCFNASWLAPNWTSQTFVNGTWRFSIYTNCSRTWNNQYQLMAKILKRNSTGEFNFINTTAVTFASCVVGAPVLRNWTYDIPYNNYSNLAPGERIGTQICTSVTGANGAGRYTWMFWEDGTASFVNLPIQTSAAPSGDTTPPTITNVSSNSSYAILYQYVNFSANVSDNVNVSTAWFRDNFDMVYSQNITQSLDTKNYNFGNVVMTGQQFKFLSGTEIYSACIKLQDNNHGTKGNVTVSIYSLDGKGLPKTELTNFTIASNVINTTKQEFCKNFTKTISANANVLYGLVVKSTNSTDKSSYKVFATSNVYANGKALTYSGTKWSVKNGDDLYFKIFGGNYSWKTEAYVTVNGPSKIVSYVKQITSVPSIYRNYQWCANDSSGNVNCKNTTYYVYSDPITDAIYPDGYIVSPINNTLLNGNVTITGNASDNTAVAYASIQYKNSTVGWTNLPNCDTLSSPYECLWDTSLFSNASEGYDIRIVPCDTVGNCNTSTISNHYTIDRSIPIANYQIIYPGAQTSVRNSQTLIIKINATAAAGINTSIIYLTNLNNSGNTTMTLESGSKNPDQWSVWNLSVALNGTTTGINYVKYYVRDNSTPANKIYYSEFPVNIDNQAPTYDNDTYGYNPESPVYNDTNVTFQVQASDNYYLSYYKFANNFSGTWTNQTANFTQATSDWAQNTSRLYKGGYGFYFIFYDEAGNSNQTLLNIITIYSAEPPSLNITLKAPTDQENITTKNVTFSYNYTGPTANSCTLLINFDENLTTIAPANQTTLYFNQNFTDGYYSWYVSCNNTYGTRFDSDILNFNLDATPPAISIASPANTTYNNKTQLVNISTTGAQSVWWYNGSANITYSAAGYYNFSEGNNVLYAYANDTVGNLNSTNVTFGIDTTAPVITVYSPLNQTYYNITQILINFTADSYQALWYYNGSANVPYTSANYVNISYEQYTFVFYANDTSGNLNSTNVTFSVIDISDITPPASITNLKNQSANTTWIYWNWTNPDDSDFSSAILYLNNVNVANTSNNYYNANGLLSGINYTLRINTRDLKGNVNYTNASGTARTISIPLTIINESSSNSTGATINTTLTLIAENGTTAYNSTELNHTSTTIQSGYYTVIVEPVNYSIYQVVMTNTYIGGNTTKIVDFDSFGIENTSKAFAINIYVNFTSANVTLNAQGIELQKCLNWNFTNQTCIDGNWTFVQILTPGENYTFILNETDPGFTELTRYGCTTITCWNKAALKACTCAEVGSNDGVYASGAALSGDGGSWAAVLTDHINSTSPSGKNATGASANIKWYIDQLASSTCSLSVYKNTTGTWYVVNTTCQTVDTTYNYNLSRWINTTVDAKNIRILMNMTGAAGAPNEKLYYDMVNVTITWEDITPPVITLNSPAPNVTLYNRSVVFNWSATDNIALNSTCNLTIDSIVNKSNIFVLNGSSTNQTVSGLAPGLHLWNVSCADDGGNNVGYSATRNFTIDTSIPSIQFIVPTETAGSIINRSYILANVTASDINFDNLIIRLYNSTGFVDDAGPTNDPYLFTSFILTAYTSYPDGIYYINATATDTVGNLNSTETINVTVDTTAPQINFTSPTPNNGTILNQGWIFVNITSNENLSNSILEWNNVNESMNGSGTNWYKNKSNLAAGTYNFRVYGNDSANNWNSTELRTVFINGAPNITLHYPENNSQFIDIQTINFNFTATDDINATLNCSIYLDTALNQTNSSTKNGTVTNFTISEISYATHAWYVNCSDGWISNISEIRTFSVTDSAPVFLSVSPAANLQHNQTDTVIFRVNMSKNSTVIANVSWDATSQVVNLSYNGSDWWFNRSFSNTLYPGVYSVNLSATSNFGSINSTLTNFTVNDITNPSVAQVQPASVAYKGGTAVNISANVSDYFYANLASVKANVSWDAASELINLSYNSGIGLFNGTFANSNTDGLYILTIIAVDNAGNVNNSERGNFTIDAIAPVFSSVSPATNSQYNQTDVVLLKVNMSKNSTVTANVSWALGSQLVNLIYNGSNWWFNGTFTNTLYPGVYSVNLSATDVVGNVNSTLTNFVVNDITAPLIENVIPIAGSNYNQSINILISANVTDYYYNSIDKVIANVTWNSGTQLLNMSKNSTTGKYQSDFSSGTVGRYNVTISANDTSGNSNSTETWFYINDSTAPVIINVNATKLNNTSAAVTWTTDEASNSSVSYGNSISLGSIAVNSSIVTSHNIALNNLTYGQSYYYNVTSCDISGNCRKEGTFNFTMADSTPPQIISYNISSYAPIINETIFINASATDDLAVYGIFANITLPNGITTTFNLPLYFNATLPGRHNVTIFANDTSGNIADLIFDYFIAGYNTTIQFNVIDSNLSGIDNNLTIYLAGTNKTVHEYEFTGSATDYHAGLLYDLLFRTYNNSMLIKLLDINISLDSNQTLGVDKTIITGYKVTYGINSTYNSSKNATVTLNYTGISYSNENSLSVEKCANWTFTSRTCSSDWIGISAEQNKTLHLFTFNVTSFSAFSIKETVTVGAPSASGGISGGGKYTPACEEKWQCTDWGKCEDGIVRRSCTDTNSCGTEKNKPEEAGSCATVHEKCSDNVQNQEESDVDCGGGTCKSCEIGQKCSVNRDCNSNYCYAGFCKLKEVEIAQPGLQLPAMPLLSWTNYLMLYALLLIFLVYLMYKITPIVIGYAKRMPEEREIGIEITSRAKPVSVIVKPFKRWLGRTERKAEEAFKEDVMQPVRRIIRLPGKVKDDITERIREGISAEKRWLGRTERKAEEAFKEDVMQPARRIIRLPGKIKEDITERINEGISAEKRWLGRTERKAGEAFKEEVVHPVRRIIKLPGKILESIREKIIAEKRWLGRTERKAEEAFKEDVMQPVRRIITITPQRLEEAEEKSLESIKKEIEKIKGKGKQKIGARERWIARMEAKAGKRMEDVMQPVRRIMKIVPEKIGEISEDVTKIEKEAEKEVKKAIELFKEKPAKEKPLSLEELASKEESALRKPHVEKIGDIESFEDLEVPVPSVIEEDIKDVREILRIKGKEINKINKEKIDNKKEQIKKEMLSDLKSAFEG